MLCLISNESILDSTLCENLIISNESILDSALCESLIISNKSILDSALCESVQPTEARAVQEADD